MHTSFSVAPVAARVNLRRSFAAAFGDLVRKAAKRPRAAVGPCGAARMIGALLPVPLRRRARGFGASGSRRAQTSTASLNSALIVAGFVQFLLPLAVSLTARVLSFSLVASIAIAIVVPLLRARSAVTLGGGLGPFGVLALLRRPPPCFLDQPVL